MKILINDHAGHPFQVQLSRALATRGHEVLHTYTRDLQTPRGALQRLPGDPSRLHIEAVALWRPFNRYGLADRVLQERELGLALVERVRRFGPDAVISANTPLGAQALLLEECLRKGIPFVFWLQDLLGIGIRNNLRKKIGPAGSLVGRYYMALEHRLLRKSSAVVVITEDFVPICRKAGVTDRNIHVIHNWAPLQDVPVLPKVNAWAKEKGLAQTFNFIYSGTLGMKHNPELLASLAQAFQEDPHVRVVVITEGLGAEWLAEQKKNRRMKNLVLLPFQPFERLPQVLAAGDVLVAILEPDAGVFAVPSKVLTYLCARRPLLLALPPQNLAARIVRDNGAGIVGSPSDLEGFLNGARALAREAKLRKDMGRKARAYAEKHFDIQRITDTFESILEECARAETLRLPSSRGF
jgi:glycosyltransferase involved in cell wall biosynthesis